MSQKQRKRDKFKKVIKSGGQKLTKFTKSRIVRRFIPLFVLITIITPAGKAVAFTIEGGDALQFGKNATFMAAEYKGLREIVRTGVGSIPDASVRTAVSTAGSISALVVGVACGAGSGICSGLGYEQKAVVCLHGLALCSGIASGLHDVDPANPATIAGKFASDAMTSQMSA